MFANLAALAPGYDWNAYLVASGVRGKTDYVVVSQPSYISGFDRLARKTPLAEWKLYFRWRLLNDFAPYLTKNFVDEHFNFYGTRLRDIPSNKPRWKRGIGRVESSLGESLGSLYVDRYFPPAAKERVEQYAAYEPVPGYHVNGEQRNPGPVRQENQPAARRPARCQCPADCRGDWLQVRVAATRTSNRRN